MNNKKEPSETKKVKISKIGAYYAFILEFLANSFTDGPADYTLTNKELNCIGEKDSKKYSLKDEIIMWAIIISFFVFLFGSIYLGNKYDIDDKFMNMIFYIVTFIYGILSIKIIKTKGKL